MVSKGRDTVGILTVNGDVKLRRRRFSTQPRRSQDRAGHKPRTIIPVGLAIDDTDCRHRVSVHVRRFFCRVNLDGSSFKESADLLEELCGISTSAERLRQVVQAEGKLVQRLQQAGSRTPEGEPAGALAPSWTAVQCQIQPADAGQPGRSDQLSLDFAPRRVYASTDGVMVPRVTQAEKDKRREGVVARRKQMPAEQRSRLKPLAPKGKGSDHGWKELKVVKHFDQHNEHGHVSATTGNADGAAALLDRDARKLQLRIADEKLAISDGATWIARRFAEAQVPFDAVILDFWHFSEHVHAARRTVFGEKAAEGFQWADGVLRIAKEQGHDALMMRLHEGIRERRGAKRAALQDLAAYCGSRREQMDYPTFLRRGWHIGSGPMEAACRTVPHRLKGSGKRWDRRGIDAIANLEALWENQQWEAYWKQAA